MKEALFYNKHDDGKIECTLCPHNCLIRLDHKGMCNVRRNIDGVLYNDNYGILSVIDLQPVGEEPFKNIMPNSHILSVGSIGCNLFCEFCHNWTLSRAAVQATPTSPVEKNYTPEQIVRMAIDLKTKGNIGIAYTYNEPTVWFEFMYEAAQMIKSAHMVNKVVSNGFINPKPLNMILPFIDAFNIDLKASGNEFYNRLTKASIDPVLNTLQQIDSAHKHLEITYLVIPGKNDNPIEFRELMDILAKNLKNPVTLHINPYHPAYRMTIKATPPETIQKLYEIASEYFDNVYPHYKYLLNN